MTDCNTWLVNDDYTFTCLGCGYTARATATGSVLLDAGRDPERHAAAMLRQATVTRQEREAGELPPTVPEAPPSWWTLDDG